MENSKLIKLLESFSDEDWGSFAAYLSFKSKQNSKEIELYNHIGKYKSNLFSKKLSFEYLKNSHIIGLNSKKNIQNIMSRLVLKIEEYFAWNNFIQDEAEVELRLFQELNDRSMFDLANKSAAKSIEKWKNDKSLNISLLLNILRIEHKQYFSHNPIKYQNQSQIVAKLHSSVLDIDATYTQFYEFIKKLEESRGQQILTDIKGTFVTPMSKSLQEITYHMNELIFEKNENSFEFLFQLLIDNYSLDKELKAIIFNQCQNYLRGQVASGTIGKRKDTLLKLYDFGIEQEILVYNGALSATTFQNIIQVACVLKEFEWAALFRSKNLELIPNKERLANTIISRVQIAFGLKEYEEVIELLYTSEINQFVLKLLGRWLLLASHFITHDSLEFFEAQVSSFTQFIYYNKNKISQRNMDGSLNLSKVFRSYLSKQDFNLETETSKYDAIIFKNRLPEFFAERERYVKENGILV